MEKSIEFLNLSDYYGGKINRKLWETLRFSFPKAQLLEIPERCLRELQDSERTDYALENCYDNFLLDSNDENENSEDDDAGASQNSSYDIPHDENNYDPLVETIDPFDITYSEDSEDDEGEVEVQIIPKKYYLLKRNVYNVQRISNFDIDRNESLLRKMPSHVQQICGVMKNEVTFARTYEILQSRGVEIIFDSCIDPADTGNVSNPGTQNRNLDTTSQEDRSDAVDSNDTIDNPIPVFFEDRILYNKLKKFEIADIDELYSKLCELLWLAYKIQWCFIWKERQRKRKVSEESFRSDYEITMSEFPTTRDTYYQWLVDQSYSADGERTNSRIVQAMDSSFLLSSTCEINTIIAMIMAGFEDVAKEKSARWRKMLQVRLYKWITNFLAGIEYFIRSKEGSCKRVVRKWGKASFNAHLYTSMFSVFCKSEDQSNCIMWKVCNDGYIGLNKCCPMLVRRTPMTDDGLLDPDEEGDMPYAVNHFQFQFQQPGGMDKFFEVLPNHGKMNVGSIMLRRMIIAFDKEPNLSLRNVGRQIPEHVIFGSMSLNFGFLFDNRDRFMNWVKNGKAYYSRKKVTDLSAKVTQAALINKGSWSIDANLRVKLFMYPSRIEDRMDNYIDTNDFRKMFEMAGKGYITENFIAKLIEMKSYYDTTRNNCEDILEQKEEMRKKFNY